MFVSRSRARKAKKHTEPVEAPLESSTGTPVESPFGRSGRKMLINAQTPEELRIAMHRGLGAAREVMAELARGRIDPAAGHVIDVS